MARWWNGRHAVVRRPCSQWREGSSPSLVTDLSCPVLRLQAPALRRLVGQFDSGMGYWRLSRGFERWVYETRLAGSTPARPTGSEKALTGYEDHHSEPSQPGMRRSLQSLYEESVAKIKGRRGFRFIKELGGAVRRETVSRTARFLDEHRLL